MRTTACRLGEFAGHVTTRRLNRVEYDNTMADLLGVRLELSEHFPVDGSGGEGFNNNGETLFLPPILMERYLEAASHALNVAVLTTPFQKTFAAGELLPPVSGDNAKDPRAIRGKDELTAYMTTYLDGEYLIETKLVRPSSGESAGALRVDGIAADRISVAAGEGETQVVIKSQLRLTRGTHAISLKADANSELNVVSLSVKEVRAAPNDQQKANHLKLTGVQPGTVPADHRKTALDAVSRLMRKAYRRPVPTEDIDRVMRLYDKATERDDPFEERLKLAFKAVLVSPHFLFRTEAEPASVQLEAISDHELASRLSYFLWSTMPDDELSRLADAGQLHQTDVLLAQTERMLNDPRSEHFAEQFMGQWLGTHEVGGRVAPEVTIFGEFFNADMLIDFRDEPMYFFKHLLQNNLSLLDLLDADYAVLNRRLKEHYGYLERKGKLEKTRSTPRRGTGGEFEFFKLPDDQRGGVLGMSGVLLLTSYPDRTSPVLRGGWILETLLGIKVPSPPPDIPVLKRNSKTKRSVREQLAEHRKNPACAACHNLMDPLGFALENYDVIGRWREKDHDQQIDASAVLPTGESFTGPRELRQVLLARKSDFIRHLTRKMLGYALGRSLHDGDDCTVQQIADRVAGDDYHVRTLVREIVTSVPFRMRQQMPDAQK